MGRELNYTNTNYALRNDDEMFRISHAEDLQLRDVGADDASIQHALIRLSSELCE